MKKLFKYGMVWQNGSFKQCSILVDDDKIEQVAPDILQVEDIPVVDLSGKYVLPGLVECHTHLCMNGTAAAAPTLYNSNTSQVLLQCVISMEKLLRAGFTTVRDCGSPGMEVIALRDEVNKGRFKGPRILACGMAIKMTGGHYVGKVVDSPYEARKAVRELISGNVDFLKLMGSGGLGREGVDPNVWELELDEMRAVGEQGAKYGKAVAVHCHSKQGILNALEAGATSIEHCSVMDEEVIEKLLEKDAFVVPTFTPYIRFEQNGVVPGTWVTPYIIGVAAGINKNKREQFIHAYKAGVKIAFGRDAGATNIPQDDFLFEMQQMELHGMSRKDIIQSATITAAHCLMMQDKVGSIEAGKFADLLVLKKNPLDDLSNLKEAACIIKGGEIVSG